MGEDPKLRRKVIRLDVDLEYLNSFPADFLFRYELIWSKTIDRGRQVGENIEIASGRASGPRLSSSAVETRGGAKPGKKLAGASTRDVISNEAALSFKRRVDRKLREVNRMMRVWLANGEVGQSRGRRCTVCKRFGDDEWIYCPNDGKPMEEA
jgi:hypothetical protein